jgi:cation diffusion facilitator CzcD-associated flavoprotein CzcO
VTKHFSEDGFHQGWTLLLRRFVRSGEAEYQEEWWSEVGSHPQVKRRYGPCSSDQHFDAVIVATGRFNVPFIPAIPGLSDWQHRFPDSVIHSRQYRTSDIAVGRNVLVVGASVSTYRHAGALAH